MRNSKSPISTIILQWKQDQYIFLTLSKEAKTGAFFRPIILRDRLRDLNKRMSSMRPEEMVETLGPEFFSRLLRQCVYDEGVRLRTLKVVNGVSFVEEKKQSTTQFAAQDNLEDVGEAGEERKSVAVRSKGDKSASVLEDKNAMKELLERKRRSPWIVRLFIVMIAVFLLGMVAVMVAIYFIYTNISGELKMSYTYAEVSCRKTAELLSIKSNMRSMIFRNM